MKENEKKVLRKKIFSKKTEDDVEISIYEGVSWHDSKTSELEFNRGGGVREETIKIELTAIYIYQFQQ